MIRSVMLGKSGRNNRVFYKVIRVSKNGTIREYRYDNTNVPKTVDDFIKVTPFEHVNNCLLFR